MQFIEQKSIENHASGIKLSTLDSFAKALGKKLEVRIV